MSPRRLLTAVLVSASVVSLSACERSHIKASANVRLSGKVLAPEGGPARDVALSLLKRPDAGEVIGGLTVGLATVGLVCAIDSPPTICRSVRKAITDAGGRFSYELRGSDTQGSIGNADTLSLTASAPGPGAEATAMSFRVQHERVVLPTLRLWDARLAFDPATLTPHWRSLPRDAATGSSSDMTLLFSDADTTPVWEQAHAGNGSPFDARLLEDAAVNARVSTATSVNRNTGSYDLQYLSAQVHLSGPAGAPDSRGAACIVPRPHGVAGVAGASCWLTDGDLAHRPGGLQKRHTAAVIDLGGQRPISLIAVRGEPDTRTISVSSDGRSFRPLATRNGGFEQLTPHGLRARYVRLHSRNGTDRTWELSVWEHA